MLLPEIPGFFRRAAVAPWIAAALAVILTVAGCQQPQPAAPAASAPARPSAAEQQAQQQKDKELRDRVSSLEKQLAAEKSRKEDKAPVAALPAEPAAGGLADDFSKLFRGTVGRFAVEIQLKRTGPKLRGGYLSPLRNRDTALVGTVDGEGNFTLDEFQRGEKHTGIYQGRFLASAATAMQGTWTRPDGKMPMRFELTEAAQ